jgi:hypothetical protein
MNIKNHKAVILKARARKFNASSITTTIEDSVGTKKEK